MSICRRIQKGKWPIPSRGRPGASIVFGDATVTTVRAQDDTPGQERRWIELILTEGTIEVSVPVNADELARSLLAAAEWRDA